MGISISSGQLNNILIHGPERFDQEQEALLLSAKLYSPSLQVYDTGARHNGKNGYATFIGNECFSYFKSTESKSRIHFLELLPGDPSYLLNEQGYHYLTKQSPAPKYLTAIAAIKDQWFTDRPSFQAALETTGIHQPYAVKTITEAALLGALMEKGMAKDMVFLSDDVGQFTILTHALCWIHVERNLQKIHTYTPSQRQTLDQLLTAFWKLYQRLQTYSKHPHPTTQKRIEADFDHLSNGQTEWIALKKGLDKLKTYKEELLICLDYPATPLHNNQSERDIREYVRQSH
ncbi:MAG: transposase [Bacteroidota bacterium]